MNEQKLQQFIDTFFEALGLMQLEKCQEHLQTLQDLTYRTPKYQPWYTYLTGILANELHCDWAEGERLFQSLLETKLEPDLQGRVLIALGRTYDYQGRWIEALEVYERCLEFFNQPQQAINRVTIWRNMAITLEKGFTQGEFDETILEQAVSYCWQALETLKPLPDQDEDNTESQIILWNTATTWNTLGLIYRSLGNWPQATNCFEHFSDLAKALNDRYDIGAANHNLGEVLHLQGPDRWPAARQAYCLALEIYQDPEFNDQYQMVDVLANLALLHHDLGDLTFALDYYHQAIERIEYLRAGVTSEAGRAGYFATVSDTYANAVLLCLEMDDAEQAFNYAEQARSRAFLDMLAIRSADLSQEIDAQPMTLAEVQAALPPDTLLLEYFTTGLAEVRLGPAAQAEGVQRHRFPPAKTLLFAVTREAIEVHDLGISPNNLRPRDLDSVVERHFLKPNIRRALYRQLIEPVEPLLTGKRLVYLVPHGPLHYIPFQALTDSADETLLREDGPHLHYAPSATLLFRQRPTPPKPTSHSCLAVGYNGRGAARLRFAEHEARGVARLTGGQALVGDAPKKATFYEQAATYRRLHISCHGEFDPEAPLASALQIGPNEWLTGLDVLDHLNFRGDLVTLSACESGLNRVRRGDELVGLVRAFMYAGASALVCTLWRVDERSTWLLMRKFYQQIEAGVGFAQALKEAQLYLRSLTRREVLDHLVRFSAAETGAVDDPTTGSPSAATRQPALSSLSRAYLKGLKTFQNEDQKSLLLDGPDDEKIFAAPFYWAPFILIGSHGSQPVV